MSYCTYKAGRYIFFYFLYFFYKNITINLQLYLFVDFAKVFDVIDNDLLLGKVALYGLHNDTLHLISSFRVKSRTAFV